MTQGGWLTQQHCGFNRPYSPDVQCFRQGPPQSTGSLKPVFYRFQAALYTVWRISPYRPNQRYISAFRYLCVQFPRPTRGRHAQTANRHHRLPHPPQLGGNPAPWHGQIRGRQAGGRWCREPETRPQNRHLRYVGRQPSAPLRLIDFIRHSHTRHAGKSSRCCRSQHGGQKIFLHNVFPFQVSKKQTVKGSLKRILRTGRQS